MKITQQAVIIEHSPLDQDSEVPIMAVNLLPFSGKHQSVSGGEGCVD